MIMREVGTVVMLLAVLSLSMGIASAHWDSDDFHEMNGTVVGKEIGISSIEYMVDVCGTVCYLSGEHQPHTEFYEGDNVTLNGTVGMGSMKPPFPSYLRKDYHEEYPELILNNVTVNGSTYRQMMLAWDLDTEYY